MKLNQSGDITHILKLTQDFLQALSLWKAASRSFGASSLRTAEAKAKQLRGTFCAFVVQFDSDQLRTDAKLLSSEKDFTLPAVHKAAEAAFQDGQWKEACELYRQATRTLDRIARPRMLYQAYVLGADLRRIECADFRFIGNYSPFHPGIVAPLYSQLRDIKVHPLRLNDVLYGRLKEAKNGDDFFLIAQGQVREHVRDVGGELASCCYQLGQEVQALNFRLCAAYEMLRYSEERDATFRELMLLAQKDEVDPVV